MLFDLARRHGTFGDRLQLFAASADLDLPVSVMRGVALLARCAGLVGHLAEEQTDPIGMDVYLNVDRNRLPALSARAGPAVPEFGSDRCPNGHL